MADSTNTLNVIVGGFIALILGIILIGVVADSISTLDDIVNVLNESITMTSGVGTTSVTEDVTSLDFFGNATINTGLNEITIGTEANLSSTGNLVVVQDLNITVGSNDFNNSVGDGTYNISYTHEGVNFVANKTARTLINLITIFFALAVLAIGFMIARDSFPDLFR